MTAFPPKGEGKLVMTSDFITIHGQLKYLFRPLFFYQGECSSYRLDEEQYQPILDQMLAAD